MNTRPIAEACDPDLRGSMPALKRAARRAASVAHAQERETPYDDQE
ncbi:MAG TPA: hypothetical protein PKZ27_15965 [Rhodocyclaceae bacterium]|nr:hypothetical protein [Rhodocyclaceae bacterium]